MKNILLLILFTNLALTNLVADSFMLASMDKFNGALGPVKVGSTTYPKYDTTMTGPSVVLGDKTEYISYASVFYFQAGSLNGDYRYLNRDNEATINYYLVGYRFHIGNRQNFIRPIFGADFGTGDVSVQKIGLAYTYSFVGLVTGVDVKITKDTSLNLIMQTANNDGATYKRYSYGIAHTF